jgi:hypothetical protein
MKYTKMTKREIVEYGTEVGIKLNKKLTKAKLIAQLKSYLSTLEVEETSVVEKDTVTRARYIKDVNRMLTIQLEGIDILINKGMSSAIINDARKRYEEMCKEYPV